MQVPGNAPNQMLRDIALAVEGFYLPHDFEPERAKKLEEDLHACFLEGQTYSFVIFNEHTDVQSDAIFSSLDVDWKTNKIDDSLCIGQSATAIDEILAVKLAQQMLTWINDGLNAGKLIIHSGQAKFKGLSST